MILDINKVLGSHVVAKTVQGSIVESGKVIIFSDSPMVCIENVWTGKRLWWRLDLTSLDTVQDTPKAYGPF